MLIRDRSVFKWIRKSRDTVFIEQDFRYARRRKREKERGRKNTRKLKSEMEEKSKLMLYIRIITNLKHQFDRCRNKKDVGDHLKEQG